MKKGIVFSAFLVFFLAAFVSADISVSGNNIKQTYSSGDYISGSITLNMQNVSYDSILSTNLNGSITIGDLLNKDNLREGYDYNCSSVGCNNQYNIGDKAVIEPLYSGSPNLVGFKLTGSNIQIQSMSLKITGDSSPGCSAQIYANMFDNSSKPIQNNKYLNQTCSVRSSGCFDSTLAESSYTLANISSTPYCIKQTLGAAPAYMLGAHVISPGNISNDQLKMDIYPSDFSTTPLGECLLDNVSQQGYADVSCNVNYAGASQQNYYICISSERQTSAYLIKTEQTSPTCGAKAPDPTPIQKDFDIYVQPLMYDSPAYTLSDNLFNVVYYRENFTTDAQNYIQQNYNGDCVTNSCILPISINGADQTVSFSNPSLVYTSSGIPVTETSLYSLNKTSSEVNAQNIVLNIAPAGFSIPYGNQPGSFVLSLDNQTILTVPINVSLGVLFDVSPKFALIGIPTNFGISAGNNITSASWNFNDGTQAQSGTSVIHSFSQAGIYTANVQVSTSDGKTGSRAIQIIVGEPEASANELLNLDKNRIKDIESNISAMPDWIQPIIRNRLNITNINDSVNYISAKMAYASNSTEFISVITELQALDVPSNIAITKSGEYPLTLAYSHIDLSPLSGQINLTTSKLEGSLVSWLNDNYDSKINISTLSSSSQSGSQPILSVINITLNPKSATSGDNLVINYPLDAISFKEEYGQKQMGSSTVIPLSGASQSISFGIPSDVGIDSLGIYVYPSDISKVAPAESIAPAENTAPKQTLTLALGIASIILLVCVIAFVLQFWYKKKYESYLFKNNDDLFNMMTFIYNSRVSKISDIDIRKKLSSTGWTKEQIAYAFDKLNGKVLGIFGIPIFKASQESKVKAEIEKRQSADGRFIKRKIF